MNDDTVAVDIIIYDDNGRSLLYSIKHLQITVVVNINKPELNLAELNWYNNKH